MQKTAYHLKMASSFLGLPEIHSSGYRIRSTTLLVMKLTMVLLITAFLSASATGVSQEVSFTGKNVPLEKVFQEIKKQTGYVFFYTNDALSEAREVSLQVSKIPLTDFLNLVLSDQDLKYSIESKTITVTRKHEVKLKNDFGKLHLPALLPIRGKIVGFDGKPLSGATIKVKGSSKSAIADNNGAFEIDASLESRIIISFTGYEDIEVSAKADLGLIQLTLKNNDLDQVLVQAYGTTSRRLNTGNIAKVTAAEIEKQPVSNPLAALQGKVAGMLVTPSSGIPGGAVNIEIRGRTAIDKNITSDQPLFVIDGVPYSNGNESVAIGNWSANAPSTQVQTMVKGGVSPFQGINPQDIESIEVLKDADATAIYGSRGANGVILITTKRGVVGKSSFSINSYQGVSFVKDNVEMMSTDQYIETRKKAFKNSNQTMTPANAPDVLVWDINNDFKYADIFIDNVANTHNSQISFDGGNKLTQFSIRGGFHRENTIMDKEHKNERINMSFSLNQKSNNEKFNILFTGSFGNNENDLINQDMSRFRTLVPNMRMIDDEGNLIWENGVIFNPFGERLKSNRFVTKTMYANIQPGFQISKRLKASMNLGYNYSINDKDVYEPLNSSLPTLTAKSSRFVANSRNQNISFEPQLNYKQDLAGGELNLLLGGTFHTTNASLTSISATNFPSNEAMRFLTNALSHYVSESASQYKYLAAFGRINYNYHNTYLLNITARRDGSSRFGDGKRFSTFGAIGASWIFSNAFSLTNAFPWLSFGKIRGSIGNTGNDKITDYQYLDTWAVNTLLYPQLNNQFLNPDKLFNPEYHWESTRKTEIAVEFGLLNDRILFSPVYFRNTSSNQLVNYKLATMTGFSSVVANLPATVVNSGIEFTLSGDIIRNKDFTWHTAFNISKPKNILKAFPNIENSSYYTTHVVGKPLNVIYTYDFTGVDPQTGEATFRDVDKDGKMSTKDYVAAGSLDPRYYGGIQNSFTFKNFQLDIFFQFRNSIGANYLRFNPTGQGDFQNWPVVDAKVWENPGDVADVPKYESRSTASYNNFKRSNAIYSNASYLRLNNASFYYRIPDRITSRWGISVLRVYVLGQNLWTISPYKVGDPEIQSYLSTPSLRTITGGLQLTF